MSLVIDENGMISLYQGDSGEIVANGLDNNKNYIVYFAIQNKKRELVGQELQVSANKTDSVSFFLTPGYTDLLTVPNGKPYEIYTYGIKACEVDNDIEDTLFVGDSGYGDLNFLVVYPRKVAGA